MEKPKISFVVAGRNDNYGGHLVNRLNTMVKVIGYLSNKYKLPCEIVFVEYNPVKDKKYLFQEIEKPSTNYLTIKGIVVPYEYHSELVKSKMPMLEYVAKNIGVRRASADYVLVTNPDIIFSEEIIKFIAENKLNSDIFYRVNRHDISLNFFNPNIRVDKILSLSKNKVTKIFYPEWSKIISWKAWFNMFIHGRTFSTFIHCPLLNPLRSRGILRDEKLDDLHGNAAGDFMLMHRNMWEKVEGYDETPLSSFMDSYLLYVLKCFHYQQEIIPYPIYHINHEIAKGGRKEVSISKYKNDITQMKRNNVPYHMNGQNWGAKNRLFLEINL